MTQCERGGDVQTGRVKPLSDADASPKVSFDNGGEFIRQTRRDVEEYLSARRVRARGRAQLYAKGVIAFAVLLGSWLTLMTDQLLAELRKMRSTRTNLGLLAGMIALILLTVLLNGFIPKAHELMSAAAGRTGCPGTAPGR